MEIASTLPQCVIRGLNSGELTERAARIIYGNEVIAEAMSKGLIKGEGLVPNLVK